MEIKKKVDRELLSFAWKLKKDPCLNNISPLLFRQIREFVLREGKRVRPTLFILGYLSFTKKPAPGLFRSALSIELLHDFMLVHDDIIDKSDTRRGKPSVHKALNDYLKDYRGVKFSGEDLAIIVGDVLYALGLEAFLAVKENPARKEKALKQLIRAALYTGAGEFIELLDGLKDISRISRQEIYKIYDYKTAYYTFSSPLAIGAILAGAAQKEVDKLIRYGIYLGRAFQIKDDLIGMFSGQKKIGKSTLSDLQEAKKTFILREAFYRAGRKGKADIRRILAKKNIGQTDLAKVRRIMKESGGLERARKEITASLSCAQAILESSKMLPKYKKLLLSYTEEILSV